MSETILNKDSWPQEAQSAIDDIKKHVKYAAISDNMQSNDQKVYINITTLEGKFYCIEMSAQGFKIVGKKHDAMNVTSESVYETPYALLDKISEAYRKSFGGELMNKLLDLAKQTETS